MILFNKHKRALVSKSFIFALITKLKTYQLRVWKHFQLKTRPSKTLENELNTQHVKKMIKTTCPKLHAINTKTHAPMSHPIKTLCLSIL